MKVAYHTTTDVFEQLKPEWNELLKRSVTDTPFSTWEWHNHWWAAYHPGDLWVISIRDDADTLVGLASLFIETTADGQRIVHFVGCEDVTDYLDLLIDAEQQDAVYDTLVTALSDSADQYDALDLCNIPQESPTHEKLSNLLTEQGYTVDVSRQEVCPVITLPENFDDYVSNLEKRQRKDLKRKLRFATGQSDSINWYTVNGTHDINEELDKFVTLMAASHPEKAQFLEDEQHVQFFKGLVPAAHDAGWLQLNFLEITGEPVAAYLNFDYNNKILVYNSGLDPDKAAALSPGIILLAYNIEHAIEEKRDVFDFLRGDEQYKYRMGGEDTEIFNLKAQRA